MNLLELVQQACNELGLLSPSAVATSTDPQYLQFLALLNSEGNKLVRDYEWQQLSKNYVFTTETVTTTGDTTDGSAVITNIPSTSGITTDYSVSGDGLPAWAQVVSVDSATQVTVDLPSTATGTTSALTFYKVNYDLPSDWLKQTPNTEWDRTNRWPLLGPKSAQEWAYLKGGIVSAGPRMRYRIMGDKFELNPNPAADKNLSFEYISKNWVESSAGTGKTKFTADDDVHVFDDHLLVLGLKLRWLMSKGLAYDWVYAEYMDRLNKLQAQNKSAPILSLAPATQSILLGVGNLPETGYGR
jgi:hypothetical protein